MDKSPAWRSGSLSRLVLLLLAIVIGLAAPGHGASDKAPRKRRFFVVSSYHREYNWSIETNKGFCDAILCGVDDSGYDQGFQAVVIARDILEKGARPETYPPVSPGRGASVVNVRRARMLGLSRPKGLEVDERVEKASALGG